MSVRIFAEREYRRSNSAQLSQVKHWLVDFPWKEMSSEVTRPDRAISSIQSDEATTVSAHLNRDLAIVNCIALFIGGILSYWFAGRALRPIEEAHRAQTRFAADASHELRTPLASMRIENEVFLRQKEFSQEEAREQIESNLEEVQRLENLSNNLLALTHYEHNSLALSGVDVKKLVREAVDRARKTAEAREVAITTDIKPATLVGNYDSLVQLLGILLENALKYGPQKGAIVITGKRESTGYALSVSDVGPGIAEADIPHIFERLYRGDKARTTKAGGYGLGLALAHQITRANNGVISVRNIKPKGACFTVQLTVSK